MRLGNSGGGRSLQAGAGGTSRARRRIEGGPLSSRRARDGHHHERRPVAPPPPAASSSPSPTTTSTPDYDRMPALFVSEDAFALPSYWDRRYDQSSEPSEEWYRGCSDEASRAVVAAHLDPHLPVLQLGVGTSRLQEAMAQGFVDDEDDVAGVNEDAGSDYDDGENDSGGCFASVLSVDFSSVAIERQQQRLEALLNNPQTRAWASRLSYAQADVRSMPELADSSFSGGVLDKGALDALLCGDDADDSAAACLSEAWRLLAPGAAYVMITSAAPAARRRLLPTADNGGGAVASLPLSSSPPLPVWAGVLVYRLGQQGALAGPAALGDAGGEGALLAAHETDERFRYSHYAYVCVKG